jgi:Flp pilus assembly protein TadG
MVTRLVACVVRLAGALARRSEGSILPMFALSMVPLVGMVGAAVDYGQASSVRVAMQTAADATALMAAKLAGKISDADLSTKATEYFNAMLNRPSAGSVLVSVNYQITGGSQVTVSASSKVKTHFMPLVGLKELELAVSSQVRWGTTKLQVALALDNTGSMAEGLKMSALKKATKSLLTTLEGLAVNPGDVRVAIIPFAEHVNVGKSNWEQSWLDWAEWENRNGKCSDSDYRSRKRCLEHGKTWTPKSHDTWNGCITDRNQDFDVKNTLPDESVAPGSLFPPEQASNCPLELRPLNYDFTSMRTMVDNMTADGLTNQPIGLAWAWQALSTGNPLNAPIKAADMVQTIVLFSDGLNTQNRWSNDAADIDARQAKLCENAKKAGVVIYTVLVMAGSSKVMKDCASQPDYYYELTNANDTVAAFNDIGTKMSKLRIAN